MVFYATIQVNPTIFMQEWTKLSLSYPFINANTYSELLASHEFGHVFNLDDFFFGVTGCSATTIMYDDLVGDASCSIIDPQQYCDGGLFDTWYTAQGVTPENFEACKGCAVSFCGY
jgi:hypothetical protein